MRITASWLFNRICDEPERMKADLMECVNNEDTISYMMLGSFLHKYQKIQQWEKEVAAMKLEAKPAIEIASDHKYIEVIIK